MTTQSESKPPRADDYSKTFRQLCVIARYELNAHPDMDWGSVREICKTVAAKARLPYSSESVDDAMVHVKASTRYRGPAVVPAARVARDSRRTDPPPQLVRDERQAIPTVEMKRSGQFTSVGAIFEELARRKLLPGGAK